MSQVWKKSVTLELEGPGQYTTIDSTQGASWAMIEDWPLEDHAALDHALLVCADVSKGKRPDEDAREAFIAAAKEAGIAIKE